MGHFHDTQPKMLAVYDYIKTTWPFWNRKSGADHLQVGAAKSERFCVTCDDSPDRSTHTTGSPAINYRAPLPLSCARVARVPRVYRLGSLVWLVRYCGGFVLLKHETHVPWFV